MHTSAPSDVAAACSDSGSVQLTIINPLAGLESCRRAKPAATELALSRVDIIRRVVRFLPASDALRLCSMSHGWDRAVAPMREELQLGAFVAHLRAQWARELAALPGHVPPEYDEWGDVTRPEVVDFARLLLMSVREARKCDVSTGAFTTSAADPPCAPGATLACGTTSSRSEGCSRGPWGLVASTYHRQYAAMRTARLRPREHDRRRSAAATACAFCVICITASVGGFARALLGLVTGTRLLAYQCEAQSAAWVLAANSSVNATAEWANELGISTDDVLVPAGDENSTALRVNVTAFQLLSCGFEASDKLAPRTDFGALAVSVFVFLGIIMSLPVVIDVLHLSHVCKLLRSKAPCTGDARQEESMVLSISAFPGFARLLMHGWRLKHLLTFLGFVAMLVQFSRPAAPLAAAVLLGFGARTIASACFGLAAEVVPCSAPRGAWGLVLPPSLSSSRAALSPIQRRLQCSLRSYRAFKIVVSLTAISSGAVFVVWGAALSQPWEDPAVLFGRESTILGPLHRYLGNEGMAVTVGVWTACEGVLAAALVAAAAVWKDTRVRPGHEANCREGQVVRVAMVMGGSLYSVAAGAGIWTLWWQVSAGSFREGPLLSMLSFFWGLLGFMEFVESCAYVGGLFNVGLGSRLERRLIRWQGEPAELAHNLRRQASAATVLKLHRQWNDAVARARERVTAEWY